MCLKCKKKKKKNNNNTYSRIQSRDEQLTGLNFSELHSYETGENVLDVLTLWVRWNKSFKVHKKLTDDCYKEEDVPPEELHRGLYSICDGTKHLSESEAPLRAGSSARDAPDRAPK